MLKPTVSSLLLMSFILMNPQMVIASTNNLMAGDQIKITSIPTKSLFKLISNGTDLTITVSRRVPSVIQDVDVKGSRQEMIEEITRTKNMDWFKIGNQVFITDPSERISRIIKAPNLSARQALEKLDKLGFKSNIPSLASNDNSMLTLSGPARFIAYVEELISQKTPTTSPPNYMSGKGTVRIIKNGTLTSTNIPVR